MLIDKNQDGTLPHNRARELWAAIHAKGLIPEDFCARKWATCREAMVRCDIVRIVNRKYGPGKAMEWAIGQFFPFLAKKEPTVERPVVNLRKLVEFHSGKNRQKQEEEREEGHNTLLLIHVVAEAEKTVLRLARPPP